MNNKLYKNFLILLIGFFPMTAYNTPANAKKICSIYWGMDKSDFLSAFPDAIPEKEFPTSDGKYSSYTLPNNNICSQQYSVFDKDEVSFIFYNTENLKTIRVGVVGNYTDARIKLIEKYGKPVYWEPDGDCVGGGQLCYKKASFNDRGTKSKVFIESYSSSGNFPLVFYSEYPSIWLINPDMLK